MLSSADPLDVLIVDDDPALLRTMSDVLRLKGFEPGIAQTGRQAMELAQHGAPAIAVVDLRLPDMDGLDLITRLHSSNALTEVVVLTGNASVTSAVRALREHIFDYLLKPVAPDQLVNTLERAGERWRRRRAEAALAESELRFRSLIENASDPIAILDEQGMIRYASPAYERSLGREPQDLIGSPVADWMHPDDAPALRDAIRRLRGQPRGTATINLRFRHRDGSWRTLSATGKNLLLDPAIGGIVLNSRDITERLELEAQLRHVQKLEAIGQLAGGIAHDLNNILTAITSFSQFAVASLPAESSARSDVEQVEFAAQRAATLTRQLLAFSRQQVLQPQLLSLNDVVRGMERMMTRLIDETIRIELRLDSSLGFVMADPGQIEQVLLNLVLNARDAMPAGGVLTIETGNDTNGTTTADLPHEPRAMLRVVDTGTGMDDETQTRIFEPFFTTKPVGKGTGLGLSTVYGIVSQSGGAIFVKSERGHGSAFTVTLPLCEGEPEDTRAASGGHGRIIQQATILVVEDDASVRRVAQRALELAGYTVHTASNGREALTALDRLGAEVDLVVSDFVMPELGGKELARQLGERWPDLPVLFMSGYAADPGVQQEVFAPGTLYIEKPFTPAALAARVGDILRRRDG
jgi:two-component system, cell cycle sensor histidine kinase and response regulator CckA